MKLHTKLLVGFGSLWAVFFLATIVALYLLQQQSSSLDIAFHSNFESVDACANMIDALDQLNTVALTSAWTQAPVPEGASVEALTLFQQGADRQRHNITLPGEAEMTERTFQRAEDYQQAFEQFAALKEGNRQEIYARNLMPKYFAARHAAEAVTDLNFGHLQKVKVSLEQNLTYARVVQIAFAIAGAAFAIASVFVLGRTILGPLRSLTQSAREVETGNLDLQVPVRARDELGELAIAFNSMAVRLREYRQLDSARLQRSRLTTQLAIDSLPDAVTVINTDGHVEIANRQARVHFGLSPESDPERDFPKWFRELASATLATGRPVEPEGYESAVQLFDEGVERFMLPRAVPMFGEEGAVIGVLVTLVDVTRLRQADEIKSSLVSTVSHELKTPLAAARFSVHLLAEESVAPLDERQRRLVKAACEGTDRLHHIIENLLQFQRFEEGRQSVRMTLDSPATMVERARAEMAAEFGQHEIFLKTDMQADLPAVQTDSGLTHHVLTNLLSNALKFVPRGGHVWVSAKIAGEYVEFTVADNGPGVPQEHVPKLFSRFYRAAAPPGTPGAGLGLSIARQLITAQGGDIHYENRPGGGAAFVFVLRRAETQRHAR